MRELPREQQGQTRRLMRTACPRAQLVGLLSRDKRAAVLRSWAKVKTAREGEKRMEQIARLLEHDHESAARSLPEGMRDMFTLQRLQISDSLHKCLATTNIVESP